jgi:hypothetical protein
MSEEQGLGQDELEEQEGEALPDREAMSIVDIGDGGMSPPFFEDPPVYDTPGGPADEI